MPTLHYFPVRGRGEMIRLAYAYKGIELDEAPVDYAAMKTDLALYPFGQSPRLVDGEMDAVQSNAILRFIGREYNLYGSNNREATMIDMVMDGVEDIRRKYLTLIYQDELKTKDAFIKTHIDPSTANERNGGAHWLYLAELLERSSSGYMAGSELSIADIACWDLLDTHLRIFADEFNQHHPALVAYHSKIAAIPAIKAYLESPKRLEQVNGNKLG